MAFHLALSSAASVPPSFGFSVTEKLTRNNYPIWQLQVMSTLKGAQLASYINSNVEPLSPFLAAKEGADSKELKPNPNYEPWVAKDQTVLSFLLPSLSKEILGQVPTTMRSTKEA